MMSKVMTVVSRCNQCRGEVPLVGLGESELERIVRVDGEKPGVDSRDEGKHTIDLGTICYSQRSS